jgi:diguanylate cyclase (GGDEF)-like protein
MSYSQRHFARLKTRQLANMVFPNGEMLACEICDFCQKGLNLRPVGSDLANNVGTRHATGEEVKVEFPANGPRHILLGKLIHSSATDFGLYVDNMSAEAFQALFNARADLPQPGLTQGNLLPEERQAIFRDCVNLFHTFLGQAWDELISHIRKRVSERDAYPLPLGEHSRFLNGLTDLLLRIDDIRQRHFDLLVERMQHVDAPMANTLPDSINELSIVDEDSFEDWLNVSGIFNHIESENRGVMFQFALRFSRLTPVEVTPRNDPFGPQATCLTFQQTLAEFDFNNAMRAILYKRFGKTLDENYGGLYAQLNQLLAPLKPIDMPLESGHDPVRATRNEAPRKQPEKDQENIADQVSKLTEIAEKLFTLYPPAPSGGEARTAVAPGSPVPDRQTAISPDTMPESSTEDAAAYHQQLQQILEQIAPTAPAPTTPPPAPPGPAAASAGVPTDRGTHTRIENLLRQFDSVQAAVDEASLSGRISRLLSQPTFAGQLSQPLREELGAMASLLNRALAEHSSQSDIDRLLKKIEKPLYDLALRSDEPIHLENHPLGRLINLVDRFAIVADENGRFHDPQFRDLVESIIDKGLGQAEPSVEDLENACNTLEKLLKYPAQVRKQRVDGYQEIGEAKGRIRDSNQLVVDELNQQLTGRAVPKIIPKLLELGWQHRLVLLKLRGDDMEWEQSWQILAELAHASEPASGQIAHAERQRLLDAVESRLLTVTIAGRQLDDLMKELVVYLQNPAQAERVLIPEGWFKLADGQDGSLSAAHETLTGQLRIGDWWEIEQNDKTIPMQLIWLSQPPGRTCFVNRSADRKLDLTLDELSLLIDENRAKSGEDRDLPLLERSEYGVIDAMYRRLVQQATHEPITNLPNRKSLLNHIDQAVHFNSVNSFCVLRFEPYRMIFDHCGIQAGENFTRTLATMTKYTLGSNDRLAVIGEGEFAIFLPGLNLDAAQHFTERLRKDFDGFNFRHDGENFSIQVYFGLASYLPGAVEASESLRRATSACEVAHSAGPGTIQVYADSDNLIQDRETMEGWAGLINDMLSNEYLFLRCQKVAPLQDAEALPYYEVLLGVRDKNGVQIDPQPFVLAVERWKRAHELDLWVFSSAIAWIRRNRIAFEQIGGFSINLSAQSLSNSDLLAALHRELSAGDLPCDKIIFEITETATLFSHAVAQDFIRQIRRYGCRFSLDDFGSGNASFSYLRSLRTDTLKIDGAFVRDMADDPELQAMVRSMNEIGHTLGMKTVAEFVATPELLALVREFGIDYAQGYEVEKPIPIDRLIDGL